MAHLRQLTVARFLAGLWLALAVAVAPASAEEGKADSRAAEQAPPSDSVERLLEEQRQDGASSREARLEILFERLAEADEKERADTIAGNIRRLMLASGSPTVDILMLQANRAMREKDLSAALDVLDAITRLAPDYPEGWNMRATIHFMREDYSRSLSDIERVLALEPRHWGALTGLAMILVAIDEDEDALLAMDRALAVHPHLERLKERRDELRAELDGRGI